MSRFVVESQPAPFIRVLDMDEAGRERRQRRLKTRVEGAMAGKLGGRGGGERWEVGWVTLPVGMEIAGDDLKDGAGLKFEAKPPHSDRIDRILALATLSQPSCHAQLLCLK